MSGISIEIVPEGECVALLACDRDAEARLRQRLLGREGVGYVGHEFRAYPHMTIARARRFYAGIAPRWDDAQLTDDLAACGLDDGFEIGRMKVLYQRAVALVLVAARAPDLLVVERADDFADAALGGVLERVVLRAPRTLVTLPPETTDVPAYATRTYDAREGGLP